MVRALALAQEAAARGEVPVGAVLTDAAGEVLAEAHNLVETDHDPTAHAELLAIRQAARKLSEKRLEGAVLYVTLELVYAAYDPKAGGVDHGPRIFEQPGCNHRPEVISGFQEQAASALLKEFFAARR